MTNIASYNYNLLFKVFPVVGNKVFIPQALVGNNFIRLESATIITKSGTSDCLSKHKPTVNIEMDHFVVTWKDINKDEKLKVTLFLNDVDAEECKKHLPAAFKELDDSIIL